MPRSIRYTAPLDTSHFTGQQLQSRFLLANAMNAWARWVSEHMVSFRRLLIEHQTGVVVLGGDVAWLAPFGFFDADALEIEASLAAVGGGRLLRISTDFRNGDVTVARVNGTLHPVNLGEMGSLAAKPSDVPPELLARFRPDEIVATAPDRPLLALAAAAAKATPIATFEYPIEIRRSDCEVADQWSFIEHHTFAAASREAMCLTKRREVPELRDVLHKTVRTFCSELSRPLFLFDRATVFSSMVRIEAGLAFVHEIESKIGSKRPHAKIVELMNES
jgi:hypothetical protein